jgi:hypothetical protein
MATNDLKNEKIFLSYQWDSHAEVKQLKEFLRKKGFEAWMDIHQLSAGSQLTLRITSAILGSEIFIACITKKYAASEMCSNEIHLAKKNNKRIIPLYFEELTGNDIQSIELLLAKLVRIEIFKEPNVKMNWTGFLSEQLLQAIRNSLKMTSSINLEVNNDDFSKLNIHQKVKN